MSLAPLNPIQMLPARDRVAAALREAILSHQFAEGEELTLKDTAAQLGRVVYADPRGIPDAGAGRG